MMLGFKDRFVPFVVDGSKDHTLRAGDRWKPGMRGDLYQRPRQRDMRLLFRAPILTVRPVIIRAAPRPEETGPLLLEIAGERLDPPEADRFAETDGFRPTLLHRTSTQYAALWLMWEFWRANHDLTHPWDGQVIHWDYANRFKDVTETCSRLTLAKAQRFNLSAQ